MNTNEKLTEVLNDLILINNDRSKGYQEAAKDTKLFDGDLIAVFNKNSIQSKKFAAELIAEVNRLGGEPTNGTTAGGAIHRAWISVKATFTGKSRQSVLESCEFGEDAAQKAYKAALASDANINAETRQLIVNQQSSLKTSHDNIKQYRDAAKAVAAH